MGQTKCTGIQNHSGIIPACFVILDLAGFKYNEKNEMLDMNFPNYYYDDTASPTEEQLQISKDSRVFKKGKQLLLEKAFAGVYLPSTREPATGISLETLERFFDSVASMKGITWDFLYKNVRESTQYYELP